MLASVKLLLFIVCLAATTSCRTGGEDISTRYSLPSGASVSVSAAADGSTEVSATIPPGHAGAGTWTSRDPNLIPSARRAMEHLNDPRIIVTIEVNRQGDITEIVECTIIK